MSIESEVTTLELPAPPINLTFRYRLNVYCPGCGIPIHATTGYVYADTLWCPQCPPPHAAHRLRLLKALHDPRLVSHMLMVKGLHAYSPHDRPIVPVDQLRDLMFTNEWIDDDDPTLPTCPFLVRERYSRSLTVNCPNDPRTDSGSQSTGSRRSTPRYVTDTVLSYPPPSSHR